MSLDGDERPEGEEEDLDASFQFFLELAKILVLELPSPEENSLAAAWVTRLEVEPETDEEKRLRVDYLKLLLFVMQRGRLIGIFKNEPPEDALQPFPQGLGLAEMGNLLLEQAELQGSGDANATGVSYSVEISNDLKEFVAAQEIPDFGIQVYYAWSMEEPIHKWSSFDEKKFPQYVRDKIRQLKTLNSEEKTNVQSNPQGDSSVRKTCDSDMYDKTKAKVKSPQEIEKILDRSSHKSGSPSLQGIPKEGEKGWQCGKKSRSSSKKSSPEGTPRKMEPDITRLCRKGFQDSGEDEYNFEASTGGIRGRGQDKSGGCGCAQNCRRQETESSKRLQKCDNGAENGGAFPNEVACMAGSGQRNPDRYGGEMYPDNPKCGGENMNREKPICPAARLYLMNQGPTMKSRKTKCTTQGNAGQQQTAPQDPCGQQQRQSTGKSCPEDPGKKCNYSKSSSGKTCSSPPSSLQPCTCSCPREEKETRESPCPKKKSPSEKSCSKPPKTSYPDGSQRQRRPLPPDEIEDGQTCNAKMPYQMPFDNVNVLEGCTCMDGAPPQRRLEGLSRLGLGKTTPDACITDIKPSQQQQSCPPGRRKGGERQEKRQQLPCQPSFNPEDGMPASCLKARPTVGEQVCEANKKANSCPPPRTKPSNMNSAYYTQMKSATQDNYRPSRPEYGANSCGAKIPDVDMGACGPPPCGERNFEKNLQYTSKQQQECGQAMTPPGKRQFLNEPYGIGKNEKPAGGINESMFQEMISPITPREFVDDLSFSSAEEPCNLADFRDADGQDEACNMRNGENNKYDDAAGEDDDDEDIGTGTGGYSSSSDNVQNGGAGQNYDDYEGNECQKGPPRRRPCTESPESQGGVQASARVPGQQFNMPCNVANGPGPTPFNSPPPNYKPPGTPFPMSFGGGNAPCTVPYNTPNYNQLGQPYPMLMGNGNQLGPGAYNSPQGTYNQGHPGFFSTPYTSGGSPCTGSYNPSQATYNQLKAGQTFTIPCGAGNQSGPNSYGPPQGSYNQAPGNQQFLHPNVCSAPSRQRQTPEMRSGEGSRRGMSIDPRDFPHSIMENYPMPATSTPYNTAAPPPPPDFYLSPIAEPPQSNWMRMGAATPCPRLQTPSEGPVRCGGESMDSKEWVSLRSARRSSVGKSYNRSADQSSDLKRQIEPDSLENSGTVCQHGSYGEETQKWRELPKSTRFQRNLEDRSCYK